jgi:hypothetical protein
MELLGMRLFILFQLMPFAWLLNPLPDGYFDKKFNELTWLTSHNSHLNWKDSSVLEFASNQNLSIDDQLLVGVRGFMFDIDYKSCSYVEKLLDMCHCEGSFYILKHRLFDLFTCSH